MGCKGTTRDGRPCAAHAAILGASGYCHWHDPALGAKRVGWGEGRKGARWLRWFARVAPKAGHAITERGNVHPDCGASPLPPLDLVGIPAGQRRVIVALLAEPTGRTYPATAAALGLHPGTVHRHLARLRQHWPGVYAAVLAHRAVQLATGRERTAAATRGRRAQRRADHRARYGCEPWARRPIIAAGAGTSSRVGPERP
ncbi:MAG TPA: hypothetical protein VIL85_10900 [Thermomicrobiales bacterium]